MEFVHEPPCKKPRRGDEAEAEAETTSMDGLPREILLDILSRLPVTSLVRFRLVCRSWRALGGDPLLPDAQLARTAAGDPFLVFHSDFPLRNQLSFVELSAQDQDCGRGRSKKSAAVGKFNPPFLDSMTEFEVVGSCNGLLCLADSFYRETLFVYNPFTGDCRELPRSQQYPDQTVFFGFGFHPATREYKVIKIAYYPNPSRAGARRARRVPHMHSEVQVLTLGRSPTWRSLGRAPYQIDKRSPEMVVVDGRLHWVAGPRRYRTARQLVSFDLADEQFQEVPRPEGGPIGRSNYQLMALRGRLAAVVYCNYGRLEIWVMRFGNAREEPSWLREHVVGSYMPKALKQSMSPAPFRMWRGPGRVARVVCGLDGGEILLEYKGRALVAYDPKKGKFRDISLQGMPSYFHALLHVGSLSWIDSHPDT